MTENHVAHIVDPTDPYYTVSTPITKLLAEHFGIDLVKLDDEKRAMLDALREAST